MTTEMAEPEQEDQLNLGQDLDVSEMDTELERTKQNENKPNGATLLSVQTVECEAEPEELPYYMKNSFKHAFTVLDVSKSGSLGKSQLHVVCANICRVLGMKYLSENFETFKGQDCKTLTWEEFLGFLERHLLQEVRDSSSFDKLEDICWLIVDKARSEEGKIISSPESSKLWKVFKKVDIDGQLQIHKDEAAKILENFVQAMGTPWTPVPMDDYSEKEEWTFWDLLECIEQKYIQSTPRSVYQEGLESIVDTYVKEVVKTGLLTKKGHKVKSLKQRWFVLQPDKFSYYTSKSCKELKGVIAINEETTVENIRDSRSVKCRFTVTCGDKNVPYEMDAPDQRTKNEWITAIQTCIDCVGKASPLYKELVSRKEERAVKKQQVLDEERKRLEQEELIQQQIEELEAMRLAREKAEAQAEEEAAMLEEERKRREELEAVKVEYEKLLEEERKAREEEEKARQLQEKILEEEQRKREQIEEIKAVQESLLEEERKRREGLEEQSKEQARLQEEERLKMNSKMKELEEARQLAEEAVENLHGKLEVAEEERRKAAEAVEAAKNRTRNMKMPIGLAKPLQIEVGVGLRLSSFKTQLSQKGFVTHRGAGSFVTEDFNKIPLYLSEHINTDIINRTTVEGDRIIIEETNLVKPSEKEKFFKDEKDEV